MICDLGKLWMWFYEKYNKIIEKMDFFFVDYYIIFGKFLNDIIILNRFID